MVDLLRRRDPGLRLEYDTKDFTVYLQKFVSGSLRLSGQKTGDLGVTQLQITSVLRSVFTLTKTDQETE